MSASFLLLRAHLKVQCTCEIVLCQFWSTGGKTVTHCRPQPLACGTAEFHRWRWAGSHVLLVGNGSKMGNAFPDSICVHLLRLFLDFIKLLTLIVAFSAILLVAINFFP